MKFMQKILGFIIICCIQLVFAQKPVFKHYTTEDDLPHDITYQIIQDSNGYIWIGTDDGLTKFDGSTFKTYNSDHGLKSNYVIDIEEDRSNEFYIATWGSGLHHLVNDTIKQVLSEKNNASKIYRINKINDSIIIATGSYGYIHNLKQHKKNFYTLNYRSDHSLPEVRLALPNEHYLFKQMFVDDTLYLHAHESFSKEVHKLKGIHQYEDPNHIKKIDLPLLNKAEVHAVNKKAGLLFATSNNILFVYRGNSLILKKQIASIGERIIQIEVKNNKIYFVGFNKKEGTRKLYYYDIDNSSLMDISDRLAIKSLISDFLFDKDHGLWIASYGQGVYYLPDVSSTFYDDQFFENPDLKDLASFKGQLLVLSSNLIYGIRDNVIENSVRIPYHSEDIQVKELENKVNYISFFMSKTDLKFSDDIVLHNTSTKSYSFQWENAKYTFEYDQIITEKNDTVYSDVFISPANANVFLKKAVKKENIVYLVYERVGVILFDLSTGKRIGEINKKSGGYTNQFEDIAITGNTVWLASNMGVVKVTPKGKKLYTTKNGLASNQINSLCVDSHGILWAATQRGLSVLKENYFHTLDKSYGQNSSFTTKVLEHEKNIYAAGNNGLFRWDNSVPITFKSNTTFKINQQDHLFEFGAINFLNPKSVEIEYQLDEHPWTATANRKLDFSAIAAGEHNVVFRYRDGATPWKYSKSYLFKIVVPWYKSLWFYLILIVYLATIVIFLIFKQLEKTKRKNRVYQKTLEEREKLQQELRDTRHQIAQDFHDDLGNKLASISMQSNLLLRKTNKEKQGYEHIAQIKKDANSLYLGMRDFVWSLDYNNNKLTEVQLYLNEFGERLFENSLINFRSHNNVSTSNLMLPHYWNKQLVLTFKEAMTNALKHSEATDVIFKMSIEEEELMISLEDNGVGFKEKNLERINGLNNMKTRITALGETLLIIQDNGVKVYFKAKVIN